MDGGGAPGLCIDIMRGDINGGIGPGGDMNPGKTIGPPGPWPGIGGRGGGPVISGGGPDTIRGAPGIMLRVPDGIGAPGIMPGGPPGMT